jgi:peptidyl-prolyl cis-trans isomerase D
MLDLMRKNAGTWMIKFIFGAIIVVFAFWGIGSFRAQQALRAARVNDEVITVEEFQTAYDRLLEELRRNMGGKLDAEMLKTLQVKQQALNSLIDQRLLLTEADRLGLRVSDEQLAAEIRAIAAFQRNGAFDQRQYAGVLGMNRLTPEAFEASQRHAMTIERLRQVVIGSVRVGSDEVGAWYEWKRSTARIQYLLFAPDKIDVAAPDPAALQAFFDEQRQRYAHQPQVRVRYLFFDPRAFSDGAGATDADIQNYYDNHTDAYRSPKTVEARHILFTLDAAASPAAIEQKRAQAEEIYRQAKAGADFVQLARQHSEGPDRESGGYLGTFGRDAMVKPFADQAFSLAAGEIGPPVRTPFGWHVIKVEAVNAERLKPLAEVAGEIRHTLESRRARDAAYDAAVAAYDASLAGADLARVAAERHVSVRDAGPFGSEGPTTTPPLGDARGFAAMALEMEPGVVSEVKEFKDGYYLIEVLERIPERVPELAEVREKVTADWRRKRQQEEARTAAEALLGALKAGEAPEAAAKRLGMTWSTTDLFTRDAAIPGIGSETALSEAAFSLSPAAPLPEKAIAGRAGSYVIRFLERRGPDAAGLEREREEIQRLLLQQKQFKAFADLLADLRKRSDIQIEPRMLD